VLGGSQEGCGRHVQGLHLFAVGCGLALASVLCVLQLATQEWILQHSGTVSTWGAVSGVVGRSPLCLACS
jgi:hypothetical protein